VKSKQEEGIYVSEPDQIFFIGNTLFNHKLKLPQNIPVGEYLVSVFFIKDGGVLSAAPMHFKVAQTALGHKLSNFSLHQPYLYAVVSIALALIIGGLVSMLFNFINKFRPNSQ
jgi:hypothetical protein